jgi:medium-chain acyl-[acyl-carrier-protein] hydrolase
MDSIPTDDLSLLSNFRVTSADTDLEGRLRLGSLVNFLIQSAINSADKLGFGYGGLRQQKLFWVLSRLTIEIYKPIHWRSLLEIETWPKDIEGILYLRDFIVRDIEQVPVARATSGWLAIDLDSKRPKKVDKIHEEIFVHLKNKHALEQLPEKLNKLTEGDSFEIGSTFFDMDLNKHVTSTRYVDWMMDSFPLDYHLSHSPKKISINFMKETLLGDKILLKREKLSADEFLFEGTNSTQNSIAYKARITF